MGDQIQNVYIPADLSKYPLKQRFLIHLISWSLYAAIKLVSMTVRFEFRGREIFDRITEEEGKAPILALWHDGIFLSTYLFRGRGLVMLASQSFDGEYISRLLQKFGFGVIRGSSTRGGRDGLFEMIRAMNQGLSIGVTVDGPKGPRHKAKIGPVLLAKRTGNPILPGIVQPRRYWALNTWDKLQIPIPFTNALTICGEPIYVPQDASEEDLKNYLDILQKSLDELVSASEQWTASFN